MADKTIPQLPRLDEAPAPEDLIIVQDVSDGANGTTKAVTRANFGGVQSVTGDGVGGTATDVVLTFPTAGEIGAVPTSEKGAANGVATLGADGVVPNSQKRSPLDQTRNVEWRVMPAQPFRVISTQTFFGGIGQAFMIKVSIAESINVTGVDIECTSTGVGAIVRLYVYSFAYLAGNNTPKVNLIHDFGTVDMSSTTGVKTAISNVTLPAGNYYVVAQLVAGSTPTMRAFAAGGGNPVTTFSRYDGPGVITAQETAVPLPATISGSASGTSGQPIILLVVTP